MPMNSCPDSTWNPGDRVSVKNMRACSPSCSETVGVTASRSAIGALLMWIFSPDSRYAAPSSVGVAVVFRRVLAWPAGSVSAEPETVPSAT